MIPNNSTSDDSRRSFLKKGALASVATGLGVASAGTAAAQQDGGDGGGDDVVFGDDSGENLDELFNQAESMEALMFRQHFVPAGLFTVVSPVVDYTPDAAGVEDNVWNNYNMRTIRYVSPFRATVPLFPTAEGEFGTFAEELGFVVDDDFIGDDGELLVDGEPLGAGGQFESDLRQLRPALFALDRETSYFGDTDSILNVEFSPVPEGNEEAVYNRFQGEIVDGPFGTAPAGSGGGESGTDTT